MDLEKLLPKVKNIGSREELAQLVFKEGKPYFMNTSDRKRRITNVHRWEQAFRVYAAIYSQANPSRSSEIWQYVFIINKAASVFNWTNVAEYDFIFRQMMSANPQRSWGKTYNQMWNICLLDTQKGTSSHQSNNTPGSSTSGKRQFKSGGAKIKPDYCWKFNRKGHCKWGADCKFINRCSYCDDANHGLNQCPKKTAATAGGSTT